MAEAREPEPVLPRRANARGSGARRFWRNPVVRGIREVGVVIVAALVVSTLLRAFVVQMYYVPSPSMRDTLQVDDRIAVSRISHWTHDIQRGDVVVFNDAGGWMDPVRDQGMTGALRSAGEFVGLLPKNGEQAIVKRVIGMGGDHVQCCTADGRLTVNGVPIQEDYLPQGVSASDTPFDVTVPEGTLWVMGDNRMNSADSRYHLRDGGHPFISEDDVVGKVWAVIWPQSNWSTVADRAAFAAVPDPVR